MGAFAAGAAGWGGPVLESGLAGPAGGGRRSGSSVDDRRSRHRRRRLVAGQDGGPCLAGGAWGGDRRPAMASAARMVVARRRPRRLAPSAHRRVATAASRRGPAAEEAAAGAAVPRPRRRGANSALDTCLRPAARRPVLRPVRADRDGAGIAVLPRQWIALSASRVMPMLKRAAGISRLAAKGGKSVMCLVRGQLRLEPVPTPRGCAPRSEPSSCAALPVCCCQTLRTPRWWHECSSASCTADVTAVMCGATTRVRSSSATTGCPSSIFRPRHPAA